MQDLHAIAHRFDFRKDVRRQDQAVIASQILYQRADLADLVGIESDGGFVEDDHVGFMDDGLGNAHALLVPLGERTDQPAAHVAQAAAVPGTLHRRRQRTGLDLMQAACQAQVFIDLEFPIEGRDLRKIADARLRLGRAFDEVDAADVHLTAAGREVAGQHLHGCGLAGAIRPEQAEDLAAFEFQGNFAHRAIAAV